MSVTIYISVASNQHPYFRAAQCVAGPHMSYAQAEYYVSDRRDSPWMRRAIRVLLCLAAVLIAMMLDARAESCQLSTEMDAGVKQQLRNAATQYYGFVAAGNTQAVLQNAIPEIANNAEAVNGLLQGTAQDLAGSIAEPRSTFLLDATGGDPTLASAQFYCGIANQGGLGNIGFSLQNLPAGKYGLVIMDVKNSKQPYFYTFLLKEDAGAWKIANLFPRNRQIAGHDAQWYWQQARDFKSQGKDHNAWFYYLIAQEIAVPVPFVGTPKLDSFRDEVQKAQPADLPEKNPVMIQDKTGKQFQVTSLFVVPDNKENILNLVVKYNAADISDTGKVFMDNKAAMQALLAKYPEFREPFANVVARAVAPSGQDFGTMLPMKDIQ